MNNYWTMSNLSDVIGGVNFTANQIGYVFSYDQFCNKNSYIFSKNGYPIKSSFYIDGDFSITLWLKLNSYSPFQRIVNFGIDILIVDFGIYGCTLRFRIIQNNVVLWIESQLVMELDKWYHFAYTLQKTKGTTYVNGGVVAYFEQTANKRLTLAQNLSPFGESYFKLDSTLSQIKIFKGALNSATVLNEYIKINSKFIVLNFILLKHCF